MEATRNIEKILHNARVYNATDSLLAKGIYPTKRHELFMQAIENVYKFRHSENIELLQLNSIERINIYLPLISKSRQLYFSIGSKVTLDSFPLVKEKWSKIESKIKKSLVVLFRLDNDNFNKVKVLPNIVVLSVRTVNELENAMDNYLQGDGSIGELNY